MVNKLAFFGQKNFDIIQMHGTTIKKKRNYVSVHLKLTGFIAETESIYCGERAEYLNTMQVNFRI
jgi:hypothetical protein